MAEKVISCKMPASLVTELETYREKDHFLDQSEQLRSIIRKKCLELQNPYVEGLKNIMSDKQLHEPGKTAKEQVLRDLINLLEEQQ